MLRTLSTIGKGHQTFTSWLYYISVKLAVKTSETVALCFDDFGNVFILSLELDLSQTLGPRSVVGLPFAIFPVEDKLQRTLSQHLLSFPFHLLAIKSLLF